MADKHHNAGSRAVNADPPLRAALERLDQAIDRLEAAVEARERTGAQSSAEIRRALNDALAREARSRESGKEAAGKLDGLINRLETVLGT